ncbi:RNA exonuclease 4 [Dromaius novaehollandiae]|uniref:RNA exonuclease 4 n=1 Tax=Dromaius novaehollandiae TaxID=8790 RepID=UPI00311E0424
MAKAGAAAPGPQPPAGPAARRKGRNRKPRRGRGRAAAAAAAGKGPRAAAAPPRSPQEFSSNWKALRELLKQKANSSDEPVAACQKHTGKKHMLKEGKAQEGPAVNGNGNTVKSTSANKTNNGLVKDSPPLANTKPKKTAMDKNSNGAKKDGKGCKEKKKNGNIEKEQGDIKHKRRKAEEHVEQQPKEADIWFDDVDPKDIEAAIGPEAAKIARRNLGLETGQSKESVEKALVKEKASEGLTRAVAMDCEMVGVGPKGEDSIVARVSIVNQFGKCIYDKYVKPTEEVTDYRTAVSGIRPENIKTGEHFKIVQKEVADILNGRILVGHALHNDLKVLFLDHPKKKIRDTQKYKPFRQRVKNARPSLKLLCERLLNVQVQTSEHCSIQDAQAAMRLYTLEKKQWEAAIKDKSKSKVKKK